MNPICELIIQHIQAIIDAAVVIPVHRSRDAALAVNQLPSIIITPTQDTPSENNGSICWLNWEMVVAVDILVGEGQDSAAHPYRAAVHATMMDDRDFTGVSGVTDVFPLPVEYQMNNRVADIAYVRCPFLVKYRTKYDDLTIAP